MTADVTGHTQHKHHDCQCDWTHSTNTMTVNVTGHTQYKHHYCQSGLDIHIVKTMAAKVD